MKTTFLLTILTARLAAQLASVEGTVVDQTIGKLLERVHLASIVGSDSFSADAASGAMSDSAGHFSMSAMPPEEPRSKAHHFRVVPDTECATLWVEVLWRIVITPTAMCVREPRS